MSASVARFVYDRPGLTQYAGKKIHSSAADTGVNPVSAYFHDHLFVAEAKAEEAMVLLREMSEPP